MRRTAPNGTPLLGVAGWKNSGKTTLLVRIAETLTGRGYRVATVKHAHHAFDIDHAGTDSFRHREAGAGEVLLVSGRRWALMHEMRGEPELSFTEVLERLAPCDLILIEGYRREDHPKLEVRREGSNREGELPCPPESIIALVSDEPASKGDSGGDKPLFSPDAIDGIADFVERFCGLTRA